MPTRKKVVARNGSQENASPRFCRQQKKVTVIAEKKVNELITSTKKQKSAGVRSNKIEDAEETRDLNTAFVLTQDDVAHGTSLDYEVALGHKLGCPFVRKIRKNAGSVVQAMRDKPLDRVYVF